MPESGFIVRFVILNEVKNLFKRRHSERAQRVEESIENCHCELYPPLCGGNPDTRYASRDTNFPLAFTDNREDNNDKSRSYAPLTQKTELEYRIIAINKAGVGSPSNTVMAIL